ncbi:hypothetical protein H696_06149 [Fonticula alba]|uniref:SGTA homodimerisation domain-containing protein n=1 Tax=Fonticula alba TaxID=691883 RepID=A0A058YZL1_FONAL|nr:hypothetical protein H696_06149 [Fonticula alba]KCV67420.1 hypothetical protein H696_06149 [Fonticula alba]|eukprot:XP_009498174.1 hypothetical protein H696_06149 [Fonticula alba]
MTDASLRTRHTVLKYVADLIKAGPTEDLSEDAIASLEVSLQCMGAAFGFEEADETLAFPGDLPALLSAKPVSGYSGSTPSDADVAAAEKLKNDGNAKLKASDYKGAVDCYTNAIILNPTAVYYSNRAMALTSIGMFSAAVLDCNHAISLDSNYAKAYSFKGAALARQSCHEYSARCYTKAASVAETDNLRDLYLNNASGQRALVGPADMSAKIYPAFENDITLAEGSDSAAGSGASTSAESSPSAGAGGMPDIASMLPGLMNNPAIANMLNQPGLSNMMQNMMQDGSLSQMMNNLMQDPAALQNALSGLGLGGAPPRG